MSARPRNQEPDPSEQDINRDPEKDVEGHSLLNAQLGQALANQRAREAQEWARAERARRETNEARKEKRGR